MQRKIMLEEKVGSLKWLNRSAVALARNAEDIPHLRSFFDKDGISYCLPRSMGGKAFLLTFDYA